MVSPAAAFPSLLRLIMEYIALATAATTETIAMIVAVSRPPASRMTVIRRAFPIRHLCHNSGGILTPSMVRVR